MLENLILLPAPRTISPREGEYVVGDHKLILLVGGRPQARYFSAKRFQKALRAVLSMDWEVVASEATPRSMVGLELRLDPEASIPAQGYDLEISPQGTCAIAGDEAGIFYAVCTLVQLLEHYGKSLPCVHISDWPDFPSRGVMLDVSRDKVPTMETLFSLVDMLAGWKVNQLQLYTEHTFAYRKHPDVWAKASPFTGQEILELDAYCLDRFIELVPNQNSFGHMHRWLDHERYVSLSEVQNGFQAPWAWIEGRFSLAPVDPGSLELVKELYDELLPHFSSRMVNVGCDETFDLGQGRSKDEVASRGAGRVYLEYLLKVYQDIKRRGYKMQFWGDIILQHPELIPELPKDLIALDWGYEASHPFEAHAARFAETGLPFYVCPGTSAWCSIAGRSDNALGNLLNAAENGLKYGAEGYLNTDWGDYGHWQVYPISFLGFAAGAAYSWALETNRALDMPAALSRHAFKDRTGIMGCVAFQLGNIYTATGIEWSNASPLFSILERSIEKLAAHPKIISIDYDHILELIDQACGPLSEAKMDRPDADLILHEYQLTCRLLRHACRRGKLAVAVAAGTLTPQMRLETTQALDLDFQEIVSDYRQTWLMRNRPGGLDDSVKKLEKARKDYVTVPA